MQELEGNALDGKRLLKSRIKNPQFPSEAYAFVLNSLNYSLKMDATKVRNLTHNSMASQLIDACESFAKQTHGKDAKAQLKKWGIQTSGDIGDIVFDLIESGTLRKTTEEKREDFDHLPFLTDDA